ncbi:potassium channel family protein [Polymorphobacter arshaanensis]|uniref:potassium channel family protein n=1 Tax=Glacieibacterium arshaanense TaxID=2511025 RepID=UPI00140E5102|nr:potassium channel protein [Polymorphobacter arshaanensis]
MSFYRVSDPSRGAYRLRVWRRQALGSMAMLLALMAFSTFGLAFLDPGTMSYSGKLFVGLWNSANIVSTLGDFSAFNTQQRQFMIIMMLSTMFIGGFTITRLNGLLSNEDVLIYRENRRMQRTLNTLTNHVVVVGFDAVGAKVANHMRGQGDTVVIVTAIEDRAAAAAEQKFTVVLGDAGVDDDVLHHAKIDKARALIVATADPNRNLVITLMAHTLNPKLAIAVYGENGSRRELLKRAGATIVVTAEDLIATALVEKLVTNAAV